MRPLCGEKVAEDETSHSNLKFGRRNSGMRSDLFEALRRSSLRQALRNGCEVLKGTATVAAFILLTTAPAAAVTTDVDFVISPNHSAAASISYAGGVSPLIGAGI